MTTQSADEVGIVAALTTCLAKHDGFITELQQFGTLSSERFFSRIEFRMDDTALAAFNRDLVPIISRFGLKTDVYPADQKMKILIMVSKFDHCLADLLYRHDTNSLNIEIAGIVSNHETARHNADRYGMPYTCIPVTKSKKPEAEAKLRNVVEESGAELIVLARYMQILSEDMCRDYSGRIINIHHSFLPSFKGARPYHQAYAKGVKLIGTTAHYVTSDLDEGPIIEQSVARVDHSVTPEQLVAMGRDLEAQTLARAVRLHSERRAFLNGNKTVVFN